MGIARQGQSVSVSSDGSTTIVGGFADSNYTGAAWFFARIATGIAQEAKDVPSQFSLDQNYPNPLNPTTKIQFTIVNRLLTIVNVYDLVGREVATLVNEVKEPATYAVRFDGSNLASGVYFYRLKAGPFVATKKSVLLR